MFDLDAVLAPQARTVRWHDEERELPAPPAMDAARFHVLLDAWMKCDDDAESESLVGQLVTLVDGWLPDDWKADEVPLSTLIALGTYLVAGAQSGNVSTEPPQEASAVPSES